MIKFAYDHILSAKIVMLCVLAHILIEKVGGDTLSQLKERTLFPMGIGLTTLGIEGHNR